jgi:hypothetical protein
MESMPRQGGTAAGSRYAKTPAGQEHRVAPAVTTGKAFTARLDEVADLSLEVP